MKKKAQDYQNPNSSVVQADYYPRGVQSILDVLHTKYLRAVSLVEAAESGYEPNHESLEDTFKDMINYAAFAACWCRKTIPGQDPKSSLTSNKPVRQRALTAQDMDEARTRGAHNNVGQ